MTREPADVGGVPVGVLFFEIEDPFGGYVSLDGVTAGGVHDTFGFSMRDGTIRLRDCPYDITAIKQVMLVPDMLLENPLRQFNEIQRDMEGTLARLKQTTDPEERKELLKKMRVLLAEANAITRN